MPDDLIARDAAVLWHPCTQQADLRRQPPLPVVSAHGCRLRLADGRELLDGISSWWCKNLGHGHPHLVAAVRAQLDQFDQVILAGTTNHAVVRLCERVLAAGNGLPRSAWGRSAPPGRTPGRYGKVFLADNGSTGVEIALKLAIHAQRLRGQPQRTRFAALEQGYHGETIATLAVGDCGLYAESYRPLFFPTTILRGLPLRSGPGDPCWLDAATEWLGIERQLDAVAADLAAVVYEPVLQGAGGMRLYSPDFLLRLRRWADAQGVLLIADEIAAGMCRLGPMLASHLSGDGLADLAVVSKGLSGGMLPLSAVLIPDAIHDLCLGEWGDGRAFLHSNTWCGNGLAVAAANAALDILADEDMPGRVARLGPQLMQGLQELSRRQPRLIHVRGCGMMAACDIAGADPRQRLGHRIHQECLRRGALLRNLGDTLYLLPPLVISAEEIDALLRILRESVAAVLG